MSDEIPMKGGAEYDALTRWRRYLRWRPGNRKAAKRSYRRRCRLRDRQLSQETA